MGVINRGKDALKANLKKKKICAVFLGGVMGNTKR